MTEDERDDLIDRLPKDMVLWSDDEELQYFPNRTYDEWRQILGHPAAGPSHSCCKTCGCGGSCMLGVFYDSVVSSLVRELDRLGALTAAQEQAGETTSVWRVEAGCDGQWRTVSSPIDSRAAAIEYLEWCRSLAGPSVAHRLVRDDTTHSTTVEEA